MHILVFWWHWKKNQKFTEVDQIHPLLTVIVRTWFHSLQIPSRADVTLAEADAAELFRQRDSVGVIIIGL